MQSPRMSALEATANTVVTFLFSWGFQIWVIRPVLHVPFTGGQAFWVVAISTLAGFVRAYAFRRVFEHLTRKEERSGHVG
jgi:hypothetical protein